MKYDDLIDVRLLAPSATSVAIAVTIALWFFNQKRKELSYKVLSIDDESATVQLLNSGHISVVPGDYHSPLTISAGPGARVKSATVLATWPGDLGDRCRANGERRSLIDNVDGEEVTLCPVLLNDGDTITIRLVAEDLRGGVTVNGHINGVRKVQSWTPNTLGCTILKSIGVVFMTLAAMSVELPAVQRYGFSEALPAVLFFMFGYTLFSAGSYAKRLAVEAKLEPVV